MIRDLYLDYPDFTIATTEWFTIVNCDDYADAVIDDHAGETETSVMMYYYPDKVDLSKAGKGASKNFAIDELNQKIAWVPRHWDQTSVDTGVGNPALASFEKGEKLVLAIVDKLSKLLISLSTSNLY